MKQNRLTEAEERLRFALALDPDFPQLHEDLGSVLAMQGRFEDAVPVLERAIQLQPKLPLAHRKLGQALAKLGRGKDANEAFQTYLDGNPSRTAIAKGVEQLKTGRREDAIEVFLSVLKKGPDDVNAMRYLAVAYLQGKEKLDDAEALVRRATQLAPDFTEGWMVLGSVLKERFKYMDTIAAYQQAVKLDADNAEAWGGLGSAYAVAMYPEKSAEALARALAINANALRASGSGPRTKNFG